MGIYIDIDRLNPNPTGRSGVGVSEASEIEGGGLVSRYIYVGRLIDGYRYRSVYITIGYS